MNFVILILLEILALNFDKIQQIFIVFNKIKNDFICYKQ